LPPEQPIDLLNVAFENPRIAAQNKSVSQEHLFELCPDRITGRKSFAELLATCPSRRWRLVTVCPGEEMVNLGSQCCANKRGGRSTYRSHKPLNTVQN
jgi:hypothetical protein